LILLKRAGARRAEHARVPHRTIPIQPLSALPCRPAATPQEPALHGAPERLHDVLVALEPLAEAALGADVPRGAWLRELSLADGEAVVALAPQVHEQAPALVQLTFDALRRLLHDTDIYVGAARHVA
jgi:hypothetical protein